MENNQLIKFDVDIAETCKVKLLNILPDVPTVVTKLRKSM
ncbi:unnamed protein product [Ceutorhynchus assimilis]|uniref:Uncharacterized protein n=1 Tax=Ceutorhynchus assimilis TaxID=467358 RepID=A0A9N9QLE4_9CUCU|nr:unnamed protein product [Ceutorhynchus assimilis]